MSRRRCCVIPLVLVLSLGLAGVVEAGDASLIGWWTLDGDTLDSSGFENHGTPGGDPTFIAGQFGEALDFDGNDYLTMDGVADDFTNDDVTMTAWIKTTATGEGDWFSNNAVSEQYLLCILGGDVLFYEGGWKPSAGVTVNDDEWHHIAAPRENMDVKLYVDGVYYPAADFTSVTTFAEGDRWSLAQEWDGNTASDFYTGSVDDARIYDRPLTDEEILEVMGGRGPGAASEFASGPIPETETVDVLRDVVLTWTPGEFAATHDIYFGTTFEDVNTADRANPMGILVSQGQTDAAYDPDGVLDFGQTYYWRVDEVNAAPDNTIFKGAIWSFTAELFAYPISSIIASSNAASNEGEGPENTINGSGLNAADQHSILASDMFLSVPGADSVYIMYEFDQVHKLHEMLVWNYNVKFEWMLGFGLKSVTVEYSENGEDWTVLGDVELNQATAMPTYEANTTVAFDGVSAKFVKLTVNSAWGSLPQPQYGLSEVRFFSIPAQAREPQPGDDATDVSVATMLSWRAGREAVSHEVSFGTDPEALPLVDTVDTTSYAPGALDMGATYYWKIDEVNEAEAISTWAGAVWSFSTQAFLVVDDFESYTDDIDAGEAIFLTWIDGYEVAANGSTVGNIQAPFAETTIVKSGSQSMPMFYDNSGTSISEAELALAQNWTTSGVKSLAIAFAGAAGNTGQLYVKINGTKVLYDGDPADLARGVWQAWNIDLSTVGGNLSNVTTLAIGIEGAGASGVIYVDDIRLYAMAVEAIEPIASDDSDADLLGLWKLDDGSGTTAADSSGNNHTGALMNGPQWVANGANGGALQMDGADDYVVLGTVSYGDASNPGFSAALWVRTDGWNDDAAMLSNKDWNSGSNIGWAIAGGGGNNGSWQWNLSDGNARVDFDPPVSLSPISDGGWHHLCVTHDRDGMAKFYHNGLLIGERDISAISGSLDSGLPTVLGTDGAEGSVWEYWFTGAFDDVRLYNRALSSAEVAGLAGRTAPLYEPF